MRLTKAQRETLRGKFDGLCAYCGHPLGDRWHADHFESVQRRLSVRGSKLVATGEMDRPENDRIENLMPSCAPCNISKNQLSLEGWRMWLAGHVRSLNEHHSIYRLVKAYGLVVETGHPVTFYFERQSAKEQAA
jgi:5-methylcytosine-specific restriction endonuclease McrA